MLACSTTLTSIPSLTMLIQFLYAFLGTVVFGSQNEAFKNLPKSTETLIFFLLGNIDPAFDVIVNNIDDNVDWNRILYFYSYIVIMFFLMLNMFLAIVVDSYEHMKESIGDHVPPVWTDVIDLVTQTVNIAKHKKGDGREGCLSHEQVLDHFDNLMHTEAVDRDIQSHLEREKDGSIFHVSEFILRQNICVFFLFYILYQPALSTSYSLGAEY